MDRGKTLLRPEPRGSIYIYTSMYAIILPISFPIHTLYSGRFIAFLIISRVSMISRSIAGSTPEI
jgi:hypothetical protein